MEEALATQNLPSCGILLPPTESPSSPGTIPQRSLPGNFLLLKAHALPFLKYIGTADGPHHLKKGDSAIFHQGNLISQINDFFFNTASMPKWHGAINSKYFSQITPYSVISLITITIKIINGKYILIQHSVVFGLQPFARSREPGFNRNLSPIGSCLQKMRV